MSANGEARHEGGWAAYPYIIAEAPATCSRSPPRQHSPKVTCVGTTGVSPVLFKVPEGSQTRITVRYGRTRGAGKLGPRGLLRAPAAAGTWPSRLALSAEVPGDFPQSEFDERGLRRASPYVGSEKRVSVVPT